MSCLQRLITVIARLLTVFLGLCLVPIASSGQLAQSTFDINSDGWSVADWNNPALTAIVATYPVVWNSSGGRPGGYVSATDPGANWFWLSAPPKFLGNQAAAYGASLQYDLFVNTTAGLPGPLVMLTGAGQRLFFVGDSPPASFTSYSIPLLPAGWRVNDWQTGAAPTADLMQTVLTNLDGLYVDGDWSSGPETAGLDNVRLVPELGTATLLPFGALLIWFVVGLAKRRP
jgi:Laminin B (Domain IV)